MLGLRVETATLPFTIDAGFTFAAAAADGLPQTPPLTPPPL